MDKSATFRKVNFEAYKGQYHPEFLEQFRNDPKQFSVEQVRANLYGYLYTDDFANGIWPDEFSMDYWDDLHMNSDEFFLMDFEEWEEHLGEENLLERFYVETPQELLLLLALESTGDGMTPETAITVLTVQQEYEYFERVHPYRMCQMKGQALMDGVDCLELTNPISQRELNLYFDIRCSYSCLS